MRYDLSALTIDQLLSVADMPDTDATDRHIASLSQDNIRAANPNGYAYSDRPVGWDHNGNA